MDGLVREVYWVWLGRDWICAISQWVRDTVRSGWYCLMRAWLRRGWIVGWSFVWM